MVTRSRLTRVKNKRATRQAFLYLFLSVAIIFAMIAWGVPAAARLAGMMITKDTGIGGVTELSPTPPIFSDIPEATNSAMVTVSGFAQPGVEVELYLNGAEYKKILSDDAGVFEFKKVSISEGENSIYAYAVSSRGQRSEQSRNYSILLDNTAPTITLSSPGEGEVFRGSTQRIATFQGFVSEESSSVFIGERMAIVQTDGSFNLPYQMIEGDQEIVIKAIDGAGNEKESTVKIRWEP